MGYYDFAIKFDPNKDTKEDIVKRILYVLFVKRCKGNKPTITFISGDSGEGKSYALLDLFDALGEIQGFDILPYVDLINVYTPLQYPQKIRELLFNKELKKVNMIGIHEAREIINSKQWHSFIAQAIGDINATSRSVKRMMIFIISQFIRDITSDVRYTIKYYCKCTRPIGHHTKLYLYTMWKDDRDLEKPKLRKRKLTGYLVYPNGKWRKYRPDYLELRMPRKEIRDAFEVQDREAKAYIIKKKINKLIKEMNKDLDTENDKIKAMVKHYSTHTEQLTIIGKRTKRGFKINKDIKNMHELDNDDLKLFQDMLNEELNKNGMGGEKDDIRE